MKIQNQTRKTIISNEANRLTSFWEKVWGLLNSKQSRNLYFQTRFGIHTFGLRDSIDVIILNDSFKVVKLATVKPYRVYFWNIRYSRVLELPSGAISKSKTKKGDILNILDT